MNPLHINQQVRVVFVKEYPETEHTSSMQIQYAISVYGESGQHNAVLFPVFPTITNIFSYMSQEMMMLAENPRRSD